MPTRTLLRWAESLAATARTGLGFSESLYDRERFEEFNGGRPLVNIGLPTELPEEVLEALSLTKYAEAKRLLATFGLARWMPVRRAAVRLFQKMGLFGVARWVWQLGRRGLLFVLSLKDVSAR